jgi:hypothetical protein
MNYTVRFPKYCKVITNHRAEIDVSDDEFSSHESRSSGDLDDSIQGQNNTSDTDDDAEEHA